MAGAARIIGDSYYGGKLLPTITDSQDIGSSTVKWNYIYGKYFIGDGSGLTNVGADNISGILSTSHGGTNNNSWIANRLVYTSSTTQLNSAAIVIDGTNGINISPVTNNTGTLGKSAAHWAQIFGHQLILQGTTGATMTDTSTNPKITFQEGTDSQPVHLIYTDYDNYRSPAGLKVIGGASANPAWFEVEGDVYIGRDLSVINDITASTLHLTSTTNVSTGESAVDRGAAVINGGIQTKGSIKIGHWTDTSTPINQGIRIHDLRDIADQASKFGNQSVNWYFKVVNSQWKSIMSMKGWSGAFSAWEIAGNAASGIDENKDTYYIRSLRDTTTDNVTTTSTTAWHTLVFLPNSIADNVTTFTGVGSNSLPVYVTAQGAVTAVNLQNTANALLNALTTASLVPVDNDYYISQYVNGGSSTISYHRRPISKLWEYIQGKYDASGTSIAGNDLNVGTQLSAATLRTSLGLANAMHFIGQTAETITDGSVTNPNISGYDFVNNKQAGDVIIDSNTRREYVWTLDNKWEMLGFDASTQYSQTTTGNTFISSVTQATDGTVTAGTRVLDTSGTWTGNAGTATKWANAQTTYVELSSASTTTKIQGGSSTAVALGVNGTLAVANGGTGQTSIANIQAGKDGNGNTISSTYLKLSGGTMTGRLIAPKAINQIITGVGVAGQDKGAGVSPRYYPAQWTYNTGITVTDGDTFMLKIPIAGHIAGVYISVDNGSNYYPLIYNTNTRVTTHFPVNSNIHVVFDANASASTYSIDGSDSTIAVSGGAFRLLNTYLDGDTRPSGYCTTAANTAAKVANCNSYALMSKSYLHIVMAYANTAASALTLNVNGKGVKPIYINGIVSSDSNYTLPAGTYITYYDGTGYHFRTDGRLPGPAPVALSNVSNNATLNGNTGAAGDLIYWSAQNTPAHLTAGTGNGGKFLRVNSTSGLPEWGDGSTVTLNGTATTSASFYAPTGAGTSGQYLKSNGSGAPTWANLPTITLNGSAATSPSFYAPTSAGTSGYYLKSNGSGAPTWAAITIPNPTFASLNPDEVVISTSQPNSTTNKLWVDTSEIIGNTPAMRVDAVKLIRIQTTVTVGQLTRTIDLNATRNVTRADGTILQTVNGITANDIVYNIYTYSGQDLILGNIQWTTAANQLILSFYARASGTVCFDVIVGESAGYVFNITV